MKNMKKTYHRIRFAARRLWIQISLILAGIIVFIFAYYGSNLTATFIGLGLVIWGSSLLFATSTKVIKAKLITSQMSNLTLVLDNLLNDLGYDGDTFLLPPNLPGEQPVQIIRNNSKDCMKSIVPIGLHLESLFEEIAGMDFLSLDLSILDVILNEVIVEDLEIARNFKFIKEGEIITIELSDFVLFDFYNYIQPITPSRDKAIFFCPTVSALACALAKSMHKVVIIQTVMLVKQNIKIWFRLIDSAQRV